MPAYTRDVDDEVQTVAVERIELPRIVPAEPEMSDEPIPVEIKIWLPGHMPYIVRGTLTELALTKS